jgi:putative oxidoreductase
MIPQRYSPQAYALFRIVVGFLFIFHGLQKLFGMFGGPAMPVLSILWIAAVIELLGGLLVMIGLFARGAAFICSGEMAVAYFTAHQPKGGWPIQNLGEVAVLYCFAFLYIAARGAGIWSVDAARIGRAAIAKRYTPHIYAVMRIVFGFLFLFHGLQKLFGMFGGRAADLVSQRGFAGLIELVAGAMIMIGLYTRPAAFVASGEMAVAYFLGQQPAGFWPIQNRGEPAVLYCFAFLCIAARGAGPLSIDRQWETGAALTAA